MVAPLDGERAVDHVGRDGPAGAAIAEDECAGTDRGGAGIRVVAREHQGYPSDLLDRPPAVELPPACVTVPWSPALSAQLA